MKEINAFIQWQCVSFLDILIFLNAESIGDSNWQIGKMRAVALTLFSFFLLLGVSYAHVALTYPLPRKINYDFMDNFRTPEPCGGQHKGRPVLTATIIVEKKKRPTQTHGFATLSKCT